MIDYKKAEQAKELLQESGASFIIAYNDSNNDDAVCASGNYIILKSLIIGTMVQAALSVRGKYGEEMAMQELMSMMTRAAQQLCAETEGSVEMKDKQVLQ